MLDETTAQAARRGTDMLLESPKLSVDRLPVLHTIFEHLAVRCAESFRTLCAPPVTFFVNQVEARSTWDVLEAYEDSVAVIFYVPEWDARILVGLDRRFVASAVEALYGGDGTEAAVEVDRPFSMLETRIARDVCELAAAQLVACFASTSAITCNFDRIESKVDFTILGQQNVPAVVAQLLFQVMDYGGRMYILIPQPALYPIRGRLEREHSREVVVNDPRWSRQLQTKVAETEVSLQALLDGRTMRLDELLGLEVGQIIPLKSSMRTLVALECEDEALFWCRLGQSNGHFTLVIEQPVNEKDEFLGEILHSSLAARDKKAPPR